MYYLQATVNEQHGEYHVRVYLWSREQSSQDTLLFDDAYTFTSLPTHDVEHVEILTAIGRVCAGIAQKSDDVLF